MNKNLLVKSVKRIAWGYIFLHFNINIMTINLLPDWAGYLLILLAIPALDEEVPSVHLLSPLCKILMTWAVITWIVAIFGVSLDITIIDIIIGCIGLYFHFQLLTNLADIAEKYNCPQKEKLLLLRTIRTVLIAIVVLPIDWTRIEWAMWIILIIQIIVLIWLCVVLFGLRKSLLQYEE